MQTSLVHYSLILTFKYETHAYTVLLLLVWILFQCNDTVKCTKYQQCFRDSYNLNIP